MTGADLVIHLQAAASAKGVPLRDFIAPLTTDPAKWVKQLSLAQQPKDSTIERVRALIEGRDIPPPPANNFQAPPCERDQGSAASLERISNDKELIAHRRALADLAHEQRLPGETLAAAVRRIEAEAHA